MPERTGIFLGWSVNLSNFLGLGVEAGASPMYPQTMRVPPLGVDHRSCKVELKSMKYAKDVVPFVPSRISPKIGHECILYPTWVLQSVPAKINTSKLFDVIKRTKLDR